MTGITLRDITRWADEPESRDGLPELVHRLIRETPAISRLYLPTGDASRYRGWDGLATAVEGTGNIRVPAGDSAWEMGVSADVKGKADEDYDKRSKAPSVDTSFVFVTPRLWPGGRAWADARRAEGLWRDVRVLDGGDLHQWLADSPRAALWFAAKHLGQETAKAQWSDPVIAWDDQALRVEAGPLAWLTWTARLTPLLGREDEKRALLDWARTGGGVRFRFLVGEGGSGKTRLAHEVAAELAAADPLWAAGQVPADRPFPLDAGLRGCLLLVDYPEERREAVRERLRQLAEAPPTPPALCACCSSVAAAPTSGRMWWTMPAPSPARTPTSPCRKDSPTTTLGRCSRRRCRGCRARRSVPRRRCRTRRPSGSGSRGCRSTSARCWWPPRRSRRR